MGFIVMRICENFGYTYQEWEELPNVEKLRHLYYETMKAKKEQYEIDKAKKQSRR